MGASIRKPDSDVVGKRWSNISAEIPGKRIMPDEVTPPGLRPPLGVLHPEPRHAHVDRLLSEGWAGYIETTADGVILTANAAAGTHARLRARGIGRQERRPVR